MNTSVALTCVVIVLARVTDMSLDTLRTASVVQGRRGFAAILGFCEAFVFILVVAQVLRNFDHKVYALAYATGYALGTWLGISIEQRLAFGRQLATIVTRQGAAMAVRLAAAGYRVAQVQGEAQDGDIRIVYVEVARRSSPLLLRHAVAVDPDCFCVVNDLRMAGYIPHRSAPVQAR